MSISQTYLNTGTISTTEISLPNVATYSSANSITTDGVYQIFIDVNALASGDEFQFKVYEAVLNNVGSQRVIYQANLAGPQSPPVLVIPSLILTNFWDVTAKKISGTDRILGWSIRQVI